MPKSKNAELPARRAFLKGMVGATALSATTLTTEAQARLTDVPHSTEMLKDYEEHWGLPVGRDLPFPVCVVY